MTHDNASSEMPELEPLNVHCSDTRCEVDLHYFGPNRRKKDWRKTYEGQCQSCGKKLVDWNNLKKRSLSDIQDTFRELSREWIRHVFFHAPFDAKSKAQVLELGLEGVKGNVRGLLKKKIGPEKIFRDGTQTKKGDSAIHYAQHATATCCRKCLEYWHGIPRGRALTEQELDYCEALIFAYLDLRAKELVTSDGKAT